MIAMAVVLALVIGVAFSNHRTYSERLAVAEQTALVASAAEKAAQEELATVKAAAGRAADRAAANAAMKAAAAKAAAKQAAKAAAKAAAKSARKAAAQAAAKAAKAAREKAAAQAAEKAAAAKAAARAARKKAAALRHDLQGQITVSDVDGALVTQIGGRPGESLSNFDRVGLRKMQRLQEALKAGKTYPCPGGSGSRYRDLAVGAQVVISDGQGNTLATSTLVGGVLDRRGCTFSFSAEVPEAKFYAVSVMQRRTLTYSFGDMVSSDWQVKSSV